MCLLQVGLNTCLSLFHFELFQSFLSILNVFDNFDSCGATNGDGQFHFISESFRWYFPQIQLTVATIDAILISWFLFNLFILFTSFLVIFVFLDIFSRSHFKNGVSFTKFNEFRASALNRNLIYWPDKVSSDCICQEFQSNWLRINIFCGCFIVSSRKRSCKWGKKKLKTVSCHDEWNPLASKRRP